MKFKVCGRNHTEVTGDGSTGQTRNTNAMACTSPKLKSFMYSMRKDHTWPGQMTFGCGYINWGPFPTYSMVKRLNGEKIGVPDGTTHVSVVGGPSMIKPTVSIQH